jgi:hypothetical protein
MSDVLDGFTSLQDAAPGYDEAHSYYSGTVGEVFGSRVMKRLLRRQGKPFKVNVIKSVVDAVGDRLELMALTVADDKPASALLADIVKANALNFEASNVHHRACEFGDAFVMVWDNPDEDDDTPVVNYHSPLGMRIVYDPDNPRRKKYAVQAWQEKSALGATAWRVNLLYPDRIERWRTKAGSKPEEAGSWEEAPTDPEDEESWQTENPYGEVPVFHFRNLTPYGTPRHLDGYGAQDAVNKLVISHMSTIDFHVFPQRYALTEPGAADDEFDLDDDDDGFEDDDPAQDAGDDRKHGIKSGPAEVWWLKNVKSVGQFDPASSEAFTGPLGMYLRLMAQTTKTPLHMIDDSGDEPSGESRRRKDAPLTSAVRDYSKMFATVWEDIAAFALKVAGMDDRNVKATFAPAEVVTDAEGWATIKAKIESGVPVRQALAEAGYTEDQIDEWFPEGAENSLRVTDLVAVADILQKLGAAVALGIISGEEARAMLPEGILAADAPAPAAPPAAPPAPAADPLAPLPDEQA